MAQKKLITLEKLGLYNDEIKKVIVAGDEKALADSKAYSDSLAENYDPAGASTTAEQNAKKYADAEIAKVNEEVAKVKTQADKGVADAKTADDKAVAAQGATDALKGYVGEFTHDTAKTVVEYINAKTDGIATSGNLEALGSRVSAVEGDVATIKGDYLKAADKEELEGEITANSTAIAEEKSRAEGVEGGLDTRLQAVEKDYLKAADKTALEGSIQTVSDAVTRLAEGVSPEEIDGVNDLIQYVKDHGAEVTGIQKDISDNKTAIDAVEGRMDTAEGKITAVEGAVAKKAEQSYVDEKVTALEGADSALDTRLKAVEGRFGEGEGNVSSQIEVAKQAAIEAAAADATTKADKALADSKTYADGEVAKDRTRLDSLEEATHTHANKALLDTYDQTNANIKDAVAKRHDHANAEVLNGIDAVKVAAWDKVTAKADQTALQSEIERATAKETALETAIGEFVEVSEVEIKALFA